MPKRKRQSTRRVRPGEVAFRYRRRGPSKRRRSKLPLNGFPDKWVGRLKYSDFITLDSTALGSAVPTYHTFRANSLFDPDKTGQGHQPRGFDQLAAIYDHYCVIGSKITVHFENDVDNLQTAGQYCFLMMDDTAQVPGSLIDLSEESNRNKLAYKPRNTVGSNSITLTKKFSPYKMFGIPKKDSLINNVNLNAQTGTNPVEDACFTFGLMCSRTTTTNPPPVVCRVEIEYLAVFTEKRQMQSS